MTGIYYTDLLDVLAAAGCVVAESATTDGWQTRARSSGGFPSSPLGVFWHHTASATTPANDLSYMIDGSDDAPIGNLYIDRLGVCWPIAAGASNCAGKGGPVTFSRGTIPLDAGNTRGWQIEVANAGTGSEPWPVEQIDAFYRASNALNAHVGNLPSDVVTHALGVGDGWTDRKIDPAPAAAVEGPWQPRTANSSGTWLLGDIRAECVARATTPPPELEDPEMSLSFIAVSDGQPSLLVAIDGAGTSVMAFLTDEDHLAVAAALPAVPTARISGAQYHEIYRIAGAGDTS